MKGGRSVISLYIVLKILTLFDHPEEIVHLRHPGDNGPGEPLTVKQVTEKYDLSREKVIKIEPYFCCGEYEGMLITLAYN